MHAPSATTVNSPPALPPAMITLRIALSPVLSSEELVRLHQSAELAGQSVEELVVGLIRGLPQVQAAA